MSPIINSDNLLLQLLFPCSGPLHRERRRYLRTALSELISLISDSPGLLGPKVLYAVELLWTKQTVKQTMGVVVFGFLLPDHKWNWASRPISNQEEMDKDPN